MKDNKKDIIVHWGGFIASLQRVTRDEPILTESPDGGYGFVEVGYWGQVTNFPGSDFIDFYSNTFQGVRHRMRKAITEYLEHAPETKLDKSIA